MEIVVVVVVSTIVDVLSFSLLVSVTSIVILLNGNFSSYVVLALSCVFDVKDGVVGVLEREEDADFDVNLSNDEYFWTSGLSMDWDLNSRSFLRRLMVLRMGLVLLFRFLTNISSLPFLV